MKTLVSMVYSPFDIGYDNFYWRHSYFENNAGAGFATTNDPQNTNKSAEVTPIERPRAMDLAFLMSSDTGYCTENSRCETPPIHVQSANRGQPDPPKSTDSSILTSANLRENGTNNPIGALEAQKTIGENDTSKNYKSTNSEFRSGNLEGVPVRIKTTNTLGREVPRSAKRQAPRKLLLTSRHTTARLDFEKLEEVFAQIEKVQYQGETNFACPVCSSKFTTKTSFLDHLMSHLEQRSFECHLCSRQFKLEQNLQKHIIRHSETTRECHICHKILTSVAGYKMHMESHSGITYQCTICNRELLSKSNFEGHMRKHIENKVYECPLCQKKLKYKSTLKGHMRLHTGEKPYECSICHMKVTTSQILRNHVKKHW